jgi:pimeloyl-ACP methyl ester carboxylesterase
VQRHEEFDAPVAGGLLRACRWPGNGPTVVAVHGITANSLSWTPVARALDGAVTLVAPDLRGRAGSSHLPGPYGIAPHADDVVAVLDHLGLDRTLVVGHSMGGYVAALAAVRHPDRVAAVLLIEGGLTLAPPSPDVDVDAVLHALIGPAIQRLQMTFPTPQAYLDFFREHPALQADWSDALEAYLMRDLVGRAPELRSSCVLAAVRADATDTLLDPQTLGAVAALRCPARLMFAERGFLNQPQGIYDEQQLADAGLTPDRVPVERMPDVNHYTTVLGANGAGLVAARIRELATMVDDGPDGGLDARGERGA